MKNQNSTHDYGQDIYRLAQDLFPILRSITGNGVRDTLHHIKSIVPSLTINEVPSGAKVFDWQIPDEWNCHEAYIVTPSGDRICDINENNLHIVNYSVPVNEELELDDLQPYLHSLDDQPNAIPYVTTYYKKRWGFCISSEQRAQLVSGKYHVVINSQLQPGHLTYGELFLPASDPSVTDEIFLSTYVCHPSMANNEISGPCLVTFLAKYICEMEYRKYNYRIIFIPETIGAIAYLSKNLDVMKENIFAGFNVSCVGDDRTFSFIPSRLGNTLSDRIAKHVLKYITNNDFCHYSYLDRGSDERQYCSPGVDLPVASICRSKYGAYPEYHTSLDNMDLVSIKGFQGAFDAYRLCIDFLEQNDRYIATNLCEPQLGKYGLYDQELSGLDPRTVLNVLAYADGNHDLLDIAEILDMPYWEITPYIKALLDKHLIRGLEQGEV